MGYSRKAGARQGADHDHRFEVHGNKLCRASKFYVLNASTRKIFDDAIAPNAVLRREGIGINFVTAVVSYKRNDI